MGRIFHGVAGGGVGNRVVKGIERDNREGGGEEGIGRGKILGAIKRMKDGKAAGIDGIPGEVWRYGGEELERWVEELMVRIWRGGS